MSLVRNQTGFHFYPLSSGSNDTPTLSQTSATTFDLKNIPIAVKDLPYYVYGVILTITGNVVQAGGAGAVLTYWDVVRCLIDSLEIRNAWHGTPISANHVKGSMLQIIEPISCGYAMPQIVPGTINSANGTYAIDLNVFVPLCIGQGPKPHHSAQLALFYKQSQLVINPAAASVLTAASTGATFTSLAVKASTVMLPEAELRLGPVGEWIDYQSPASANQNQIALDSFGNVTGISGTLPNAGAVFGGALSSVSGLPGSFTVDAVTKYSFPFRGQVDNTQIQAFVAMQLLSMGGGDFAARAQASQVSAGGINAVGFPKSLTAGLAASWSQLTNMLFFPLVTPAPEMELTKVQLAKGTQSYFLSGPTFSGTNHTLFQHVRSFDDNKRNDAVKQIVDSGLASLVLGQSTNLGWVPKLLNKQKDIDPEKLRFLPWRLVRQQPKRVIFPAMARR